MSYDKVELLNASGETQGFRYFPDREYFKIKLNDEFLELNFIVDTLYHPDPENPIRNAKLFRLRTISDGNYEHIIQPVHSVAHFKKSGDGVIKTYHVKYFLIAPKINLFEDEE